MTKTTGLILLLFFSGIGFSLGQNSIPTWTKSRIFLDKQHTMKKLAGLGIETDHGILKMNRYFETAVSEPELVRLKNAGFTYQVLVPDVAKDFEQKNAHPSSPDRIQLDYFSGFCNKVKKYKVPRNWKLGSMGGHLTYQEMVQHLDSMKIKYPNLISAKEPIDTTKTIEGRPIWTVRISDNPQQSEAGERQALYSAIHHAREPVGMHQLIFFMWYLLENYESDPEIKALVDNSELNFVPCLNPDGYLFNQENFPNGGGMWRKNRRDNLDGTFGVDLNRNYGQFWGYDDFGSSPESDEETYRGTSGFSEPETRAMKAFCERKDFKVGVNYHTYSNLVIHPWGYENIPCEDSVLYRNLTKEMTRENNYRIGTGMEVLNYNSNGCSDDYMYNPTLEKDKIMAMTPEVGDWFWPTSDEILGLCLENIHQNLTIARSLHPYAKLSDTTGLFLKSGNFPSTSPPRIRYKLTRIGTDAGPATFTVRFVPFGPNTSGIGTLTRSYSGLALQETLVDSMLLPANAPELNAPNKIQWEVEVSNGLFSTIDTLFHFGGEPVSTQAYFENCDAADAWSGNWVIVNTGQQEGTGFLKPTAGDHLPGMHSFATRKRPFDLRSTEIKAAELSLWTKYEIEKNFDYASLSVSVDSGFTWTNICTDKSVLSSPFSFQAGMDTIIPIWDGRQARWQKEYTDLHDFLGNKVWIRFLFHSDDFMEMDGFSVDNIRVTTHTLTTEANDFEIREPGLKIIPNPGNAKAAFVLSGVGATGSSRIRIVNSIGKEVFTGTLTAGENRPALSSMEPGCYFVEVQHPSGTWLRTKWLLNGHSD